MRVALVVIVALAGCRSSEPESKPLQHFVTPEKGCELRNAASCDGLGLDAERRSDIRLAAMFYAKACRLGEKTSCESLKRVDPDGSIGR